MMILTFAQCLALFRQRQIHDSESMGLLETAWTLTIRLSLCAGLIQQCPWYYKLRSRSWGMQKRQKGAKFSNSQHVGARVLEV